MLEQYYLTRKKAFDDTLFPRSPVGMHTEPLRKLAAPKNLLKLWGATHPVLANEQTRCRL